MTNISFEEDEHGGIFGPFETISLGKGDNQGKKTGADGRQFQMNDHQFQQLLDE